MKQGCMVMTLRISCSRRSESRQIHRGQKSALSSQQCQVHIDRLSTPKALSTRNSYRLVKPSMASFTVRFWRGWGKAFGSNVQTVGRKILVFPPWKCALSHFTRCSTISNFQKHYSDSPHPHPLFDWPRPLRLFPISQEEITAERTPFWHDWGGPCRNASGYRHTHIWELPWIQEIMGNTLWLLYTCPRGLLRWRRGNQELRQETLIYGKIPRTFV